MDDYEQQNKDIMFYIYKKNLNTGKSSFFMKTADSKLAESRIKELNAESLYDDEYYYISETPLNS